MGAIGRLSIRLGRAGDALGDGLRPTGLLGVLSDLSSRATAKKTGQWDGLGVSRRGRALAQGRLDRLLQSRIIGRGLGFKAGHHLAVSTHQKFAKVPLNIGPLPHQKLV